MMTRRGFLAAAAVGPSALAALASAAQESPWVLRLKVGDSAAGWDVLDARTGESVGRNFEMRHAGRLYRAMKSGRVVKVPVMVRDSRGQLVVAGDDLLRELRLIRVLPA